MVQTPNLRLPSLAAAQAKKQCPSARAILALPSFLFGHVEIDLKVGVMMNSKMFG